ncbi:amidase family protein [Nocardia sp. NPDC051833]|uniref:amidase family protein n=1 Tax=Nocardia sp. NPDC051833 TaxID=3155674 RepID=UPI0034416A1A
MATALVTARAVATGETTATAVIEAAIDRVRQPDSAAILVTVTGERARLQAAASDRRAARGLRRGALDGVPIVWKDLFDVQGTVTTCGSASHQHDEPAAVDSLLVRRAHDRGLITVGKTTLSEFAFSGLGINTRFGTPANPLAPDMIPGGSSTGSAVAVARGLVPLAVGTDTSGSVRIPAALCGIIGFRASPGRYGPHDFAPLAPTLDSIGLFATTVTDIAAFDELLLPLGITASAGPAQFAGSTQFAGRAQFAGPVSHAGAASPGGQWFGGRTPDPARWARQPVGGLGTTGGVDAARSLPPRFVVPTGEWAEDLAPPIADDFARTVARLRAAGATVVVRGFSSLGAAQRLLDDHGTIVGAEAYRLHSHRLRSTMPIEPATRRRLEGNTGTATTIAPVYAALPGLRAEFASELGDATLLCPPIRHLPPRIPDLLADQDTYDAANATILRTTMLLSYLGTCGISLPTALRRPGNAALLSKPAGADSALLSDAAWTERVLHPHRAERRDRDSR